LEFDGHGHVFSPAIVVLAKDHFGGLSANSTPGFVRESTSLVSVPTQVPAVAIYGEADGRLAAMMCVPERFPGARNV
jgi:hypothetical protein